MIRMMRMAVRKILLALASTLGATACGHLAALYQELEATQQHYRELKAAKPLAWSFLRPRGGPGPRGR